MRYGLCTLFIFCFADVFCQNQKLLLKTETAIELGDELKCLNRLKELNHGMYLGSLSWINCPDNFERKMDLKQLIDLSYLELRTNATKRISNQIVKTELDSTFAYIDQVVNFAEENMFLLKAITDYSDNLKIKTANTVLKERISPLTKKIDDLLNKLIFQEELKLRLLLDDM